MRGTSLLAGVSVLCTLVFPAVASAMPRERANYQAVLTPVDPAATLPTGMARLADGKANDKVTVHVDGLEPDTQYPWHVHQFASGVIDPCAPAAPQGPIVSAFEYRVLIANADGTAAAIATSDAFAAGNRSHYVNVHDSQTGSPIACGVLYPVQ